MKFLAENLVLLLTVSCVFGGDVVPVYTGVAYFGSTDGIVGSEKGPAGGDDVNAVWHSFVPGFSNDYLVSLCGSSFDTTLAVYDSDGTVLGWNDDFCETGSSLNVSLRKGREVLIRVAGYKGKTGNYRLLVSSPENPVDRVVLDDFSSGGFLRLPWEPDSCKWGVVDGAVQSLGVGDGESATIYLSYTTGLGEIGFKVRTSTEAKYDKLIFRIDGVIEEIWSGETGWAEVAYRLDEGYHDFSWTYQKDKSDSAGADRVWIDDLAFIGLQNPNGVVNYAMTDPNCLGVGDLDGDGLKDIVTGSSDVQGVSIRYNNPEYPGDFLRERTFEFGANVIDLVVVDVDGDDANDVVVVGDGGIITARNNGVGEFRRISRYSMFSGTRVIDVDDIDGDGVLEFVGLNGFDVEIGMGYFEDPRSGYTMRYTFEEWFDDVGMADFDGDGIKEVVLWGRDVGIVLLYDVLGGSGDVVRLPGSVVDFELVDVTYDGLVDVVFIGGVGWVGVLINEAGSAFLSGGRHTMLQAEGAGSLAVSDYDGDGLVDVVVGNWEDRSVTVLENRREKPGMFLGDAMYTVGGCVKDLEVVDVSGDGFVDVVTVNPLERTVSVMKNRGH